MNCRTHKTCLTLEKRQVEECVLGIFHTVLFRRLQPKMVFRQSDGETFAVGTVGYEDQRCDHVESTFARCSSPQLHDSVKKRTHTFAASLAARPDVRSAEIRLSFFEKSRGTWFASQANWEEWVVEVNFRECSSDSERQASRVEAGRDLSAAIMDISDTLSQMGTAHCPLFTDGKDANYVFDSQFDDVSPYFHQIVFNIGEEPSGGTMTAFGRLVRGTFA
ncbi:autophagy-related protein 101-like [Sycon ciliatum]|uniref:autophagy-related protein 101-like n=1 Tax=Sycon ciliatum TaxID=27933 RepID=UPI0020ACC07D|eukprot:scpid92238/ scgid35418/ Autophagy-related protein 101